MTIGIGGMHTLNCWAWESLPYPSASPQQERSANQISLAPTGGLVERFGIESYFGGAVWPSERSSGKVPSRFRPNCVSDSTAQRRLRWVQQRPTKASLAAFDPSDPFP